MTLQSELAAILRMPLLHSDCDLDFGGLHRAILLEAYGAERRGTYETTANRPELLVLPPRISTFRPIFRIVT